MLRQQAIYALPRVENIGEDLAASVNLTLICPLVLGETCGLVLGGVELLSVSATIFIFIFSGDMSDLHFLFPVFSWSTDLFLLMAA